MQAAQCPEGVLYRSADLFSFNDLGQVAFRAVLRGTGVTSANDGGHFMGGPETLTKISREGDPAEPFGPGVTWKAVCLGWNSVNAWGEVNENAMIQGSGVTTLNDQVSLVATPVGLCVLGREGDLVPQLGPDAYGCWRSGSSSPTARTEYSGSCRRTSVMPMAMAKSASAT
jgi:hypothetical protein